MILFFDNGANYLIWQALASNLVTNYPENVGIIYFSKQKMKKSSNSQINKFYIDLDYSLSVAERLEIKAFLDECERLIPDFTLSMCQNIDRILCYKGDAGQELLLSFAYQFNKILKNHEVKIVFGEITWGIELVGYYICQQRNIVYANPLNIYAFDEPRLAFFDNRNSLNYIQLIANHNTDITISLARKIDERLKSDINNSYLAHKLRALVSRSLVQRGLHFFEELFTSSDYRYSLSFKRRMLAQLYNKKRIEFASIFDSVDSNYKYVLFPLHIQPEATPDVISFEFSNQLEVARQLSCSLPVNYKLIVKEHPNGFGCRNLTQLLKFKNLPNVVLIDPYLPMNNLIRNVDLVVSITGTVALEASLNNIPSIIFSNIYFSQLPNIHRMTDFSQLKFIVKECLYNEKAVCNERYKDEHAKYFDIVWRGSFDCYIYHPIIAPKVLDADNIERLTRAFYSFSEIVNFK